jgi:hypothetical protein
LGDIQESDIQSGDIQESDIQSGDIMPLYLQYKLAFYKVCISPQRL